MSDNDPKPDDLAGEIGDRYMMPSYPTKDAILERRALTQRWKVPQEKRQAMIDRQIAIAIHGEGREATQAFKAVLEAERDDDRVAGLIGSSDSQPATVNNTQNNITLGALSLEEKKALATIIANRKAAGLLPPLPTNGTNGTSNGNGKGHGPNSTGKHHGNGTAGVDSGG